MAAQCLGGWPAAITLDYWLVTRFLTWLLLERNALRALLLGSVIALGQCGLLVLAAVLDRNLWLSGPALGLLEHPGIPAIVASDFLVLVCLGFAVRRFLRLSSRVPVLAKPANRRLLRRAVNRGRKVILLQGRARTLFWFCLGVGTLFWLLNTLQTRDAVRFYGRDVFDSSQHVFSYVVFRGVLWGSWAVLYPYIAIAFLGISGNVFNVTRILARRGQLDYRLFHPDGSGGFSTIGDISFAAIMAVLALYASLATVIVTHHKLNVLQVSGFTILSAALIALTFFISWPVSQFLLERRRADRNSNYRRLNSKVDEFSALKMIWMISATPYSPYAAYQKVLINGARVVPAILAGIRLSGPI